MKGSVKKYGPTWRIRWDAGFKPDGSRDQRSRGGYATRREAEAALVEAMDLARHGQVFDAGKVTVGEFLDAWLASKRSIRETTYRAYGGHIRVYLKPLIGQVPLAALRAEHLDAMYASIREGKLRKAPGPATIRRIHATLRTALASAYKRRLIAYNPAGQVELDPEPLRERDVWVPSHLAAFVAFCSTDRLGAAFRLIAFTGLRRGECCGLRWSDVSLDQGTVTIRQQLIENGSELIFGAPKTKKGARVISLDPDTVAVLRSHKAAQATERLAWGPAYVALDLVFCQPDGSPVRPSSVSRRFDQLSKDLGLPRVVLHGLRHTHATHALAAGVSITVVANRLGHSRSSFTADTYTRVLPEVDKEAANLIAAMVKLAGKDAAASDAQ
ncbi:site-specific integrase [Acidothermaceae bacterium B102]|nr:site-specific integrase [Acidothermaceae bacterium B102]